MKKVILIVCIFIGLNYIPLLGKPNAKYCKNDKINQEAELENELFDFETGNTQDSDFFALVEDDEKKSLSYFEQFKKWFSDYYNYVLIYAFVKYLDIAEWTESQFKSLKKMFHVLIIKLKIVKMKRIFGGK
jgi:hypothetical protein